MPIVTLSHEIGAGGPEIGQQLAERLSLHYVDQELISQAALRYGLLEQKLSNLDEAKPSLFERFDAETRRYITVLQTALYEFAEKDRVVLMGRSGQWLLRGIPHVLRVRVMAPFDLRVKHLGKRLSARWASTRTRGWCTTWPGGTTRRRPGACATCTRWTCGTPPCTIW
jgi:Cytidylate kinase